MHSTLTSATHLGKKGPSSQKQKPSKRPPHNPSRSNRKIHLSGTDHLGGILVLGGKIYDVIDIYSII